LQEASWKQRDSTIVAQGETKEINLIIVRCPGWRVARTSKSDAANEQIARLGIGVLN